MSWPMFRVLALMISNNRWPSASRLAGMIFQENPGETVNGPEGRPQVMGDGIGKTFQFLVGRLQLGRAPLHPLFQLFIELVDFFLGLFPVRDVMEGKDQKIHLPGVVQYRHQGPIPVGHPPFRVVGEDEGPWPPPGKGILVFTTWVKMAWLSSWG